MYTFYRYPFSAAFVPANLCYLLTSSGVNIITTTVILSDDARRYANCCNSSAARCAPCDPRPCSSICWSTILVARSWSITSHKPSQPITRNKSSAVNSTCSTSGLNGGVCEREKERVCDNVRERVCVCECVWVRECVCVSERVCEKSVSPRD